MTEAKCQLCGEPMPAGEEMFKFHGYSGPCPKPPMQKTEVVAEYIFRTMSNGEYWLDVRVNGKAYAELGPFASEEERQRAHDDLLDMMRQTGAIDLPNFLQ